MLFKMCNVFIVGCAVGAAWAGPDLICSEINGATSFGFVDGKVAYSFGTTVCNIGDEPLDWIADTNQHPLISQTLYRLKDHQITQIGIGFVRHTLIPLAGNACNLGCAPAGFDALGVGCSSANASSVNGSQGLMGPRSQVNAFTGDFPYPFAAINQSGNAIYKRLQANLADVSDPAALYFIETQVITSAEIDPANRANNASYRQVIFAPNSATASLVGPTYAQQPAIYAWRDHGNGIGMADDTVRIDQNTFPMSEEVFVLGSRAESVGTNLWRYDYAIYNMNGQRGINQLSFNLSADPKAFIEGPTFNAPSYHDDIDDQILNTTWAAIPGFEAHWGTESYAQNMYANAIRWGTMYTFQLVVNTWIEPGNNVLGIGFFGPDESDFIGYGYSAITMPHGDLFCPADLNGDGQLNFFDISAFLGFFLAQDLRADFNPDGILNFFDVSAYLSLYSAGCP